MIPQQSRKVKRTSTPDGAVREEQASGLQLVIDSTPCLIHTGRPDGYLDFFNQTWLRYVGRALDDLQGWKWTAFIHPEDVEGILEKWRASLASGEPFLHEARVLRADGEYRWMLHHKVAVRDGLGPIVKWYGSSIDIEDRKRAEVRLQRSEFYLAEGQRLAHMGSWAFDPAGFDYWSPELFRIHGLDPALKPPTVQEYLDCVHPQDRESMANLIKGLSAKASPFDTTERIVRPNGEVRYIRCVGTPAHESESLKKYVGSAIDVTEHELVTQELRRREAYLAEAQRLSHTGSFGWNVLTDEHFWSDETFRIFEFANSCQIPFPTILERFHPQDRPSVKMAMAAAANGEGVDLECRLLLPDGRIKYLHIVGKAERDSTGNIEVIGAVMDVTARKRTEVELRRSKAHLTDAQRLSRTGCVGMEAGTKRLFWSEESARIYGYAPGTEPTPDLILQRVHPDDVDLLKSVLERAGQGGSDFDFEHRLLMPDSSIKHIYNLSHSLKDEAGNEEIVGAIMDITERRVAEEAIRRSEAYLTEAQRLSHTGSFGCRLSTGEMFWSEETFRIYGYDPSTQPSVERVLQRVHPEDRALVQERIDRAASEGKDCDVECRLLLPDESVKHISIVARASKIESGIIEFIGAVTDVTERKAAEDKIREQEMEVRQILDLAPQLVAVYGPDRERLYANRVMIEYLGLSLEEWRRRFKFGAALHPDDFERAAGHFDLSVSKGASFESELRLRKSDGSYRWFLSRCNPVRDDKEQVKRWYLALTDIDERKRTEEKLQQENVALREEIDKASMFEEIVGASRSLKAVLSRIAKVAPTDSTVLITGETGTGKELIARAVHKRSQRSGGPFVSVNCAALPPTLVSSELFGHEKGAFTGATERRLGRFEMADGGTIFLDEVGELLPDTQAALLRVLQEREFERVGGGRPVQVDVRVIAATNRDLNADVANGPIRQDLLYRLNVFPIEMPPLRERKDDILMLVEYFVQRYAHRAGRNIRSIDQKTLDLLQSYDWPGNIRELQNVIERSIILSSADVFSVDELWLSKRTPSQAARAETRAPMKVEPRTEREIIEAALAESRGRVAGASGAAAKLQVAPSTLESRIKTLKIDKRRFRFR